MTRMVYLDMDGVLADFDAEMLRIFGKHFDEMGTDSVTRWAMISDKVQDVYARLSPMSDADELVAGVCEACVRYDYTPGILTAIPKFGRIPDAELHKREWIRTRWPILHKHFNIGPHAVDKQNFAKSGDVLIDDSRLNIPQWNDAGGFGILHVSAVMSLKQLNDFLEEQHARLS